jgi:hypothetical protein
MREDTRPLREFYPDQALRHKIHYAFAHQFLPRYIHQNPRGFFMGLHLLKDPEFNECDPTRFLHARWMMFAENARLIEKVDDPNNGTFYRVSDLSMSVHELNGQPVALIQMPAPDFRLEAYFVAAVLLAPSAEAAAWKGDVQARVFTLEAPVTEPVAGCTTGLICEWTRKGVHRNFAIASPANGTAFLQIVERLLDAPSREAALSGCYEVTRPSNHHDF